jgi:hypothetical protein
MQQGRQDSHPFQRKSGIRLCVVILLAATLACFYPKLHAQSVTSSAAVYSFDIPAQSLSSALRQFAQQSRREILFTPGLVAGKKSSGVVGSMPPTQALEALLKNCGITWSTTSAGIILLHEQPKSRTADRAKEGI